MIAGQCNWKRARTQGGFGYRATSNWGSGNILSPWAVGDIVNIPTGAKAFQGRIPHTWSDYPERSQPGRYLVVTVFSIGEEDEWYVRVIPFVENSMRVWRDEVSDRYHIVPGNNFTSDWELILSSDPDNIRTI